MKTKAITTPVLLAALLACCALAKDSTADDVDENRSEEGLQSTRVEVPATNAKPDKEKRDLRRSDGSCYVPNTRSYRRHGETFHLNDNRCITYICWNGQYTFHQEACNANGRCVPVNSEFYYGCNRMRCVKEDRGSYNYYNFVNAGSPKCKVEGRCYNMGEIIESDCVQYRCVSNGSPGGFNVQTLGTGNKCRDSRGQCYRQGEVFSDWLNGRWYNHCICNGGPFQCYNTGK